MAGVTEENRQLAIRSARTTSQGLLGGSALFLEGVSAFREKRKADFRSA